MLQVPFNATPSTPFFDPNPSQGASHYIPSHTKNPEWLTGKNQPYYIDINWGLGRRVTV